ncbi:MAG TPA: hypothetical protein VMX18_00190 [Candidatus Bipolaricaulota bacterium]|nr:hypothetical protein [Candidatus Bipolaricaulota bacterium]
MENEGILQQSPEQMFHQDKVVNGIKMEVFFDDQYKSFVLYFSDLEMNLERGVHDQIIFIKGGEAEAKNVFDKAKELAEAEKDGDIERVYKQAEAFVKGLDGKE